MSDFDSANNPFNSMFSEMMQSMASNSDGALNWDVARQVATTLANVDEEKVVETLEENAEADLEAQQEALRKIEAAALIEPNVEPALRIELDSLLRVAELHVRQLTGFQIDASEVEVVNRATWANQTLDAWEPVFAALAKSLQPQPNEPEMPAGFEGLDVDSLKSLQNAEPIDPSNPAAALGAISQVLAPVLVAMQIGAMVGHMAQRCLGSYDFPIPRKTGFTQLVAPNIDALANDWSLPHDQLNLYVCIGELTRGAVMRQSEFATRLGNLIREYAAGFRPASEDFQTRLQTQLEAFGATSLDPTDSEADQAEAIGQFANNPRMLLGALQTDEQRITLQRINALVAAFIGYVDHVTENIATKLIPAHDLIGEALKRRRVEESDGQRLGEELLGLELSQSNVDRGNAFVQGVIERANFECLNQMWKKEANLPNPADIDAPGLWLARVEIDNN